MSASRWIDTLTAARWRYLHDAEFHAAVDVLVEERIAKSTTTSTTPNIDAAHIATWSPEQAARALDVLEAAFALVNDDWIEEAEPMDHRSYYPVGGPAYLGNGQSLTALRKALEAWATTIGGRSL